MQQDKVPPFAMTVNRKRKGNDGSSISKSTQSSYKNKLQGNTPCYYYLSEEFITTIV